MKTIFFLLMLLPFVVKAQSKDTIKIVMLVSDTSTIIDTRPAHVGYYIANGNRVNEVRDVNFQMQDTRPYMTYGYQTSTGELLDAYKRKLGKNIVMWIAYKVK